MVVQIAPETFFKLNVAWWSRPIDFLYAAPFPFEHISHTTGKITKTIHSILSIDPITNLAVHIVRVAQVAKPHSLIRLQLVHRVLSRAGTDDSHVQWWWL